MSVSYINKNITIKVSIDTYNFLREFSRKYHCSMASLCQDFINKSIINLDEIAHDSSRSKCSSADIYYKKYAFCINQTYDLRRK